MTVQYKLVDNGICIFDTDTKKHIAVISNEPKRSVLFVQFLYDALKAVKSGKTYNQLLLLIADFFEAAKTQTNN